MSRRKEVRFIDLGIFDGSEFISRFTSQNLVPFRLARITFTEGKIVLHAFLRSLVVGVFFFEQRSC